MPLGHRFVPKFALQRNRNTQRLHRAFTRNLEDWHACCKLFREPGSKLDRHQGIDTKVVQRPTQVNLRHVCTLCLTTHQPLHQGFRYNSIGCVNIFCSKEPGVTPDSKPPFSRRSRQDSSSAKTPCPSIAPRVYLFMMAVMRSLVQRTLILCIV
ncbi:hypothetical protein K504DRAFT_79656 [Pleomassaria siparia CBS 279.74]|uniref:Uncharacterized protein n=1 Tax=Pleomassaria siparia CBS 279.74 TaxID=1314801 RepID=A0A6G1K1I3_9PLEO|nr:hypothetical protein K504DRAFT_79656 [Pleomassaria siparia CBS 279.74]